MARQARQPRRSKAAPGADIPSAEQHTNPLTERVKELEGALERVNQELIRRNAEVDAARQAANREVFKDVVVMTALLDAKAFLVSRGGMEAALVVHSISMVETRLGAEAVNMALLVQRVKSLAARRRAGHDIAVEDFLDSLTLAERLL